MNRTTAEAIAKSAIDEPPKHHTAGGSWAGYRYQAARFTQLALEADTGKQITLEKQDDLAVLSKEGEIEELEQLKHSQHRGVITESSADWWSAIRVWALATSAKKRRLFTTDYMTENSLLRQCFGGNGEHHNFVALVEEMDAQAIEGGIESKKSAHEAWLKIPAADRVNFVKTIEIRDRQPALGKMIHEVEEAIKIRGVESEDVAKVRTYMAGQIDALIDTQLDSNGATIGQDEVQKAFLAAVALASKPHEYYVPRVVLDRSEIDELAAQEQQHLLAQLSAIGPADDDLYSHSLKTWAETYIQRQQLLEDYATAAVDLNEHDENLVDFNNMKQSMLGKGSNPDEAIAFGQKIFESCMSRIEPVGKTTPGSRFTRGSFLDLSNRDDLRVKWNPRYGDNP